MARRNQKEREPRLAKAQTGIDGVDEITGGGLPRGRTTLLTGEAGSGQTVLALQTVGNGARRVDEPGIFVAFEEGFQQVVANAPSFGWGIPRLVHERGGGRPRRGCVRAFRVVRYRASAFIANEFPFAIASEAMEVADFGPPPKYRVFAERVSTGIPRLDNMLSGGYFRGSTVLVTGMPGTAKTTLAGAFVAGACAPREPALFTTFDEPAPRMSRNVVGGV